MSREKQIEEMEIEKLRLLLVGVGDISKDLRKEAEKAIKAGYLRQSEGEWVPSDIPQEKYVCSVCGGACWYYDFRGDVAKSRYCPNCGAHMRGGKNE